MAKGNQRILVVDDESDVREMIRDGLELDGYDVLTAESGDRALEIIGEGAAVDLVITDIKMPGMDGLELIERLHHAAPGVRIVVITGYLAPDASVSDCGLDRVRVVRKPFGFRDLTDAVDAVVASER